MEQVQLKSSNGNKSKNDQSNLLKGLLLLTLGVILGISVSAAVDKIEVFSSQPEDLSHLPRNRAIRNLNSSETNEVTPLLQICRSQLASTRTKLKEERNASETVKETVKTCEASKASLEEEKAMTAKLQKEKDVCEASKKTLKSQLASTQTKLKEEKNASETVKACEASKESLQEEKATMTAKLKEEKDACETVKETLKTCETKRLTLNEENEREPITVEAKCGEPWWTYFEATDSCYYYQGLTYDDQGNLNKFLWSTAEQHCVRRDAHLVSIHSDFELDFVKKMILSGFKAINPRATVIDACAFKNFYAWIGLLMVNGRQKWSDGTEYDYGLDKNSAKYRSYAMCHDVFTPNAPYTVFHFKEKTDVNARFVCKKPAIA